MELKELLLVMRKVFFLLLICYSCSSSLDKSVFEPLKINELGKAIENDSIFEFVYEHIRQTDNILSETQKAKYYSLTYNDIIEFRNEMTSKEYEKKHQAFNREWDNKYGIVDKKIDSLKKIYYSNKSEISSISLQVYLGMYLDENDPKTKTSIKKELLFFIDDLDFIFSDYIESKDFIMSKFDSIYKGNLSYSFITELDHKQ